MKDLIGLAKRVYHIKNALNTKVQDEGSLYRDRFVTAFTRNPDNPFIVSFPRTGSHWLRLLMELYFERPSLVRTFYYPERSDFLARHVHDVDLDIERKNVIYLFREPVATVFSQMSYHGDEVDDRARIMHWSDLYAHHLDKWLISETFTKRKTLLCYDRLRSDMESEFSRLCAHFGEALDTERLQRAVQAASKGEVKSLTKHDNRVVSDRPDYRDARKRFKEKHAEIVWAAMDRQNTELEPLFGVEPGGKM
ncbi:sulfotransferase domain-containing protein [Nitratireductor sp. XY-223]|uniref:sulfotransferase domain-containing protein n=1 Tax=Nitratireductor sp. XY-223 TaxID=2561926 RepID=UPI0010AA6A07|nr:sulfotransferase domain-containing protein [Nitratireductor sp. XY-223]